MTRHTRDIEIHEGPKEELRIEGLRIEFSDNAFDIEDGVPDLISESNAVIRIFGTGLSKSTVITFTHETNIFGGSCQLPSTERFKVNFFLIFFYYFWILLFFCRKFVVRLGADACAIYIFYFFYSKKFYVCSDCRKNKSLVLKRLCFSVVVNLRFYNRMNFHFPFQR